MIWSRLCRSLTRAKTANCARATVESEARSLLHFLALGRSSSSSPNHRCTSTSSPVEHLTSLHSVTTHCGKSTRRTSKFVNQGRRISRRDLDSTQDSQVWQVEIGLPFDPPSAIHYHHHHNPASPHLTYLFRNCRRTPPLSSSFDDYIQASLKHGHLTCCARHLDLPIPVTIRRPSHSAALRLPQVLLCEIYSHLLAVPYSYLLHIRPFFRATLLPPLPPITSPSPKVYVISKYYKVTIQLRLLSCRMRVTDAQLP